VLGRHVGVAQLFEGALRGAVPRDDEHGGATCGDVRAQVDERAVDVAAVALHLVDGRGEHVVAARHKRAQRDDRPTGGRRVLQHLAEVAVGGRADVDG
jgi:hypothetical protein